MSSSEISKEKLFAISSSLTQIADDLISNKLISNISSHSLLDSQILPNNSLPYGTINAMIIEEPTSDQETINDLEIFEILHQPTFKEICDFFLDSEMIRTIESEV